MSLESFGVEALQGLFRRLVQDLSDPTLFDFDTQASVGTGDGAEIQGRTDTYEVAAADVASLRAMPEAPGPGAFDNPRGYLQYLKFFVEERIDILESIARESPFQPASLDSGSLSTGTPTDSWIREYEAALDAINAELNRFGGPRASELRELYDQVRDIQAELGRA